MRRCGVLGPARTKEEYMYLETFNRFKVDVGVGESLFTDDWDEAEDFARRMRWKRHRQVVTITDMERLREAVPGAVYQWKAKKGQKQGELALMDWGVIQEGDV